ncbi:MAG: hypothetical protein AB1499_13875 [Nitrospirota bacterium]
MNGQGKNNNSIIASALHALDKKAGVSNHLKRIKAEITAKKMTKPAIEQAVIRIDLLP